MTEKELVLSSNFAVTSADTDINARIRSGALVNWLIQMAIRSADNLGFGLEHLHQQKLFWVLSSLTIRINRPMKWYEVAEAETWPKDVHKLLYIRDFFVRDAQKELICSATSGWFAIDFMKHKPQKIEGEFTDFFTSLKDRHAIQQLPEKLGPVGEGTTHEIKSGYFDLDLNRHVTSTRYIDWMMDAIPLEFHLSHYPKMLTINYLKETGYGETIRIKTFRESDSLFHFEGFNASRGAVAFRGKIGF